MATVGVKGSIEVASPSRGTRFMNRYIGCETC